MFLMINTVFSLFHSVNYLFTFVYYLFTTQRTKYISDYPNLYRSIFRHIFTMDYNHLLSKRLKIILDECFDGNYSAMSRIIGVSDTGLGSYIRGKKLKDSSIKLSIPSAEVIANIINELEINPEWILFGKGEMKRKAREDVPKEQTTGSEFSPERLLCIIESQQKVIENLSMGVNGTAGNAKTARVKKGS